MTELAIQAKGLTKSFDRKKERGLQGLSRREPKQTTLAVDHVDLEVPRGELFGLLGPNAAGKTTLVKLLATLLLPTDGTARVGGFDVTKEPDAVRRKVGVVLGGERALYWRLTGRENLWYFSQLYNMPQREADPRIQHLLELVGLADRADERVENYSKGMKQRLHIARGLLNDPEILLLDEPTIGLDPHAARSMRALVRELVDQHGRTVVLTTHYMYEADQLSDRVGILSKGRIVACDRPGALKAKHATQAAFRLEVRSMGSEPMLSALARLSGVAEVVAQASDPARGVAGYKILARTGGEEALPAELAALVAESKAQLVGLVREEPSLEDVFVKLTGEAIGVRGEGEVPP